MTIIDSLELIPEFQAGLDILYKNKPKEKIFSKAAEEFSELVTALLQKINKGDRVDDSEILEEMVDSTMHLLLLMKFFSTEETMRMAMEKGKKFLTSKSYLNYV